MITSKRQMIKALSCDELCVLSAKGDTKRLAEEEMEARECFSGFFEE